MKSNRAKRTPTRFSIPRIDVSDRRVRIGAGVIVLLVAVLGGYWAWSAYANRSVDYATALKASPAFKAYQVGVAAASLGRNNEAEEAFQRALTDDPSNALIYNALATLYLNNQETQKALVTAETGVTRAPGSPDLYYTLGLIRYKIGQLDDAAQALRRALDIRPDYGDAALWLGNIYLVQAKVAAMSAEGGDPAKLQQALDMLKRAVALDDSVAEYHSAYAEALFQHRDLADARAQIERAIELDGKKAEYHASLGRVCDELDDLATSESAFRKAAELDPNNADALYGVGLACFKRGMDAEAIDAFRKALTKNPYHANAHEKLGQALIRTGAKEEGDKELRMAEDSRTRDRKIADMRRASAADPTNAELANNLGIELARQGDYENAVIAFNTAITASPRMIDARYQMAGIFAQTGKIPQAIEAFMAVDKLEPGYRDTNLYLARLNEKIGRKPEADRRMRLYEAQKKASGEAPAK